MSVPKIVFALLIICVAKEEISGMFNIFKGRPTVRPTPRPIALTARPSSRPIASASSSSSASFHSVQGNAGNAVNRQRGHLLKNFIIKSSTVMKNVAIGLGGTGGAITISESVKSVVKNDTEHSQNEAEVTTTKNPIHERLMATPIIHGKFHFDNFIHLIVFIFLFLFLAL